MNLLFPFLLFFPSLFNAQITTNSPAPTPTLALDSTQLNLTSVLATHGGTAFALALATSTAAEKAFNDVVEGGLTVFCPNDDVWGQFLPKFKNLTPPAKISLLEFHGVPIYMPLPVLKSNNGETNTLATDGAAKFDFTVQNDGEDVTIKTSIVTAKVDGAGFFDEAPLVVFLIDKVLEPEELFTADAVAPASGKVKGDSDVGVSPMSDSPAESPDDSPADQNADGNSAVRVNGGEFYFAAVVFGAWMGFSLL
ncbi:fasciclin-like arabinogalactan protein 1 [Benincasa hispida]|uniref:fasciclin-like arabinogalactan protein 1 n=1 Tax=Benincasa hispida TaxID=102211 RepID=UPI00190018AD|nr:fasciclin-like arabinogalactan protein 1 [Benincasa hispida]